MKDGLKSVIVLTLICLLTALSVAVTNSFTAPVIEANKQGAQTESLSQVLEGAKGFEKQDKPESCPESILALYKETSGMGYAVTVSVSSSYSQAPMLYTVGVGNDGKITGIMITNYSETKSFGSEYTDSYLGADSAGVDGVPLVSGVTYSSTAFKQGIKDVFTAIEGLGGEAE